MPNLSWITGEIDLEDVAATGADIETAAAPELRVSLVHEYVHFLQLVTSVGGIRLLADLVDLGVRGGLLLSGTIQLGTVVQEPHRIVPLLQGLQRFAWRNHPGVEERRNETMDELNSLTGTDAYPLARAGDPWTLVEQVVTRGTFVEPIWGFSVSTNAGSEFRPFSIGFLAETMARQVDRWFAATAAPGHEWPGGRLEAEFYRGLLTLLSRGAWRDPLEGADLEGIAVVIASLALATPRPDLATKLMLERLTRPIPGGALVANVADELRAQLVGARLHHADHYNEAISDVMWGAARIMDRAEYLDVHQRLVQVHHAANRLLDDPQMFVKPQLRWEDVKAWMRLFAPPPVVAQDGTRATNVDGVACESFCTPFLLLVEEKLLAEAAGG